MTQNLLKLKGKLKMSKEMTSDEKGMLASYDRPIDFTRNQNIEPLISFIKEIKTNK